LQQWLQECPAKPREAASVAFVKFSPDEVQGE